MPSVRLCLVLSGLVLLSCRQNRLQLEAINKGFETSTRVLDANCDTTVSALIHGSRNLTDQYLAVRWQPIAAKETLMAKQSADYIDSLQQELKDSHKIANERIKILFDTLLHYKQSLPGLFSSLQSQPGYNRLEEDLPGLYATLAVLPGYQVSATPGSAFSKWKDSTFDEDEMLTRIALTKLKHDLILSAYQLIQFDRAEIEEFVEDFTRFDVLEALSAYVVGPGNMIQVTAGIGEFRTEARPTIIIGNIPTTLTNSEVAVRMIKAPQKPGKYPIPVRVEYTKPDGSKAWRDDTLHYEVVAPCEP
jgi:hypothetical protein